MQDLNTFVRAVPHCGVEAGCWWARQRRRACTPCLCRSLSPPSGQSGRTGWARTEDTATPDIQWCPTVTVTYVTVMTIVGPQYHTGAIFKRFGKMCLSCNQCGTLKIETLFIVLCVLFLNQHHTVCMHTPQLSFFSLLMTVVNFRETYVCMCCCACLCVGVCVCVCVRARARACVF